MEQEFNYNKLNDLDNIASAMDENSKFIYQGDNDEELALIFHLDQAQILRSLNEVQSIHDRFKEIDPFENQLDHYLTMQGCSEAGKVINGILNGCSNLEAYLEDINYTTSSNLREMSLCDQFYELITSQSDTITRGAHTEGDLSF
jgi:hypothetical protein